MKKLFGIVVLGLLFFSPSNVKAGPIGSGELKLKPQAVNAFIQYIQMTDKPRLFLVPIDGSSAYTWRCPKGVQCVAGGYTKEIGTCERYFKKDCAVFARFRKIKWSNGINKGKKESKFKSQMTDTEIKAKLMELGFMSESDSASTFDSSDPDVVEKLKALKKLYDDGALTKEDFEKAKKKVLNN